MGKPRKNWKTGGVKSQKNMNIRRNKAPNILPAETEDSYCCSTFRFDWSETFGLENFKGCQLKLWNKRQVEML